MTHWQMPSLIHEPGLQLSTSVSVLQAQLEEVQRPNLLENGTHEPDYRPDAEDSGEDEPVKSMGFEAGGWSEPINRGLPGLLRAQGPPLKKYGITIRAGRSWSMGRRSRRNTIVNQRTRRCPGDSTKTLSRTP